MNRYIVTAVDTADSADGKARVLAVCKTEEEAKAFVKNDIEGFVDDAADMEIVCDFDKMSAHTKDYSYGCEWNVECIEFD